MSATTTTTTTTTTTAPAGTRVFIGNLPFSATWQDVKDHFQPTAVFAKVLMGSDGRSRGCGIVEFNTPEHANAAIAQFHDSELGGRKILCRLDRRLGGDAPHAAAVRHERTGDRQQIASSDTRPPRAPRRAAPDADPINATPSLAVYIGNVAWKSTVEDLHALLTAHAKVTPRTVELPRDRNDRARGFAIAKFESIDQANTAINALNGVEHAGRVLHVRFDAHTPKQN
jgi:RNA recognition motif-containing protein